MSDQPKRRNFPIALLLAAACTASFFAGRVTAPRQSGQPQSATPKSSSPLESLTDSPDRNLTDDERGTQLAALQKELSDSGWELIGPLKEFEGGRIDAKTLVQRTAEPEMRAMRLCIRMHELANQKENPSTKAVTTNMTMGLLQRHRGLSMIIEGYGNGDEARAAAGAELFEDGRKQVLASAVTIGGADSDQAEGLQRVLKAYQDANSKEN